MSPRFGIVGPSYTNESLNADAQTAMNWYPEVDESGAGNAPVIFLPTPGLQGFVNLGVNNPSSPCASINSIQSLSAPGSVTSFSWTITADLNGIKVGDFGILLIPAAGHGSIFDPYEPSVSSATDTLGNTYFIGGMQSAFQTYVPGQPNAVLNWVRVPMTVAVAPGGTFTITVHMNNTETPTVGAPVFMNFHNVSFNASNGTIQFQSGSDCPNPATNTIHSQSFSNANGLYVAIAYLSQGLHTIPSGMTQMSGSGLSGPIYAARIFNSTSATIQDVWTQNAAGDECCFLLSFGATC